MKKHYMILFPTNPEVGIWVIDYYLHTRYTISYAEAKTRVLAAVLRNDVLKTEEPNSVVEGVDELGVFQTTITIVDRKELERVRALYNIKFEEML